MQVSVIVLAAGQGTRMNSDLPKVLHHVAAAPLLHHALATAQALEPSADAALGAGSAAGGAVVASRASPALEGHASAFSADAATATLARTVASCAGRAG